MFDKTKPIEYRPKHTEWLEAVLLDSDFNGTFLIKYKHSSASLWFHARIEYYDNDKIRNVESKEMFDKDKPIEYHFDYREWREAVLLDSDFNGSYLIKHRKSPTSSWQQVTVGQSVAKEKIRNVPEKLKYHVVVIKDVGTPCIWSSTVSKAYSIGDELNGGTVVAYHEGEYTK